MRAVTITSIVMLALITLLAHVTEPQQPLEVVVAQEEVQAVETPPEPPNEPVEPITEPVAVEEPVNDPQGCEPEQYWAEEPPHDCIDKKQPTQSSALSSEVAARSENYGYNVNNWVAQCHAWAAQAGVTLNSWAIELIDRESNCNPTVWNMQGSGAYGIAQALPASKLPNGTATTPPEQLRWMQQYTINRYGSWQAAVQFHDRMNYY